jgi:hypothetical protein
MKHIIINRMKRTVNTSHRVIERIYAENDV